ncbi:MAG: hydroxysqualene dehydroxylase, partial [Thermoguttaceae bacterium]
STNAYELIISRLPLGEILDRRVSQYLEQQAVRIHRNTRILEVGAPDSRGLPVVLHDGALQYYDAIILAVPWFKVAGLFPSAPANFSPKLGAIAQMPSAAISAVHLWFDRPISPLPHAALLGKISQWIFNETLLMPCRDPTPSDHNLPIGKYYYYQVVISAAHRVLSGSATEEAGPKGTVPFLFTQKTGQSPKDELLGLVLSELRAVFPACQEAKLLHSRVVTMPRAVISMQPGVDQLRPPTHTSLPNLFLAGDWTATGWPGTMEGAVRSGYQAAEALLEFFKQAGSIQN